MKEIVLIIGGGSGIGKACAQKFSDNGYEVIIAGRTGETLEKVSKEIKSKGKCCSYIIIDIKSNKSIENMIKQLKEDNYSIKILINSAGINTTNRNFRDMDDEQTDNIISTNLTGAINLCRIVINEMRKNNGGTIIQIGSTAGVKTSELSGVVYCATKKALFSLVRSINLEESKNNIRASIIAPATVNTELLLKRPNPPTEEEKKEKLQPESIADIAYFLATQPKNVIIEQVILTSSSEVDFL